MHVFRKLSSIVHGKFIIEVYLLYVFKNLDRYSRIVIFGTSHFPLAKRHKILHAEKSHLSLSLARARIKLVITFSHRALEKSSASPRKRIKSSSVFVSSHSLLSLFEIKNNPRFLIKPLSSHSDERKKEEGKKVSHFPR